MKKQLFFLSLSVILLTTQATFAEKPDTSSLNLLDKPNIIFGYRINGLDKVQINYNNNKLPLKKNNNQLELEMASLKIKIKKLEKDLEYYKIKNSNNYKISTSK